MREQVDLDSDMGESFGAWKLGADEEMLELLLSQCCLRLPCRFT